MAIFAEERLSNCPYLLQSASLKEQRFASDSTIVETEDYVLIVGDKTDIGFRMSIKIGLNSVVGDKRVFLTKETLLLRKSSEVLPFEPISKVLLF